MDCRASTAARLLPRAWIGGEIHYGHPLVAGCALPDELDYGPLRSCAAGPSRCWRSMASPRILDDLDTPADQAAAQAFCAP